MKKYMKKIWKMSILLLVSVGMWSCEDEKEGSMYQIFESNPAGAFLSQQEDFTEWVKIMHYADLYNALNYASEDFTLFVPNNEAVQRFYADKGVADIAELGEEYAKALVLQHAVEDSILVDDFLRKTEVTTLSGSKVSITIDTLNAGVVLLNNEVRVYELGVSTFNAKLYYIDEVMIPLVETVYDRIAGNPDYSIMREAVDATGWDKVLSTITDTITELGIVTVNHHYYTILAPSNEAFAKSGINDLSSLKQTLGADENVKDSTNALYQYVAYHILKGEYRYANLTSFIGEDTTRIWETMATNQVFTVTVDSSTAEIYHINLQGDKATFVQSACDVRGKNGYVHQIDAYLPVWEPELSTVVWDLADYLEVKNIIEKKGVPYQPIAPESEEEANITDATCYTVELSSSGGSGLRYITCVGTGSFKECMFYDRVAFSLGYMGSVTMRTPTIIRGKYRVEISFVYSSSDHKSIRQMTNGSTGGRIRMTFDGDNVKDASPYTTLTNKSKQGLHKATLYDEITFENTSDHEFKFVVLDPAASTNAKYNLQFDCITFIPITE